MLDLRYNPESAYEYSHQGVQENKKLTASFKNKIENEYEYEN
ncbi:MAG: hypothetical protein Q8L85_09335 [Alphaproteobacteria bacterium]|nr:hypothetical protein [Alphaproteobacteria bacterium]